MKLRTFLTLISLPFLPALPALGQEAGAGKPSPFPEWSFCVAYQVRDPDDRDARPLDPASEKDPLDPESTTWIPEQLLHPTGIIDVAALTTRTVKSAILKPEAANQVILSTTQGTRRHPKMVCYEPHHIFVFYSADGQPVAAIEVCLTCRIVKTKPEFRTQSSDSLFVETADLESLARIASEAGLKPTPYSSLESCVQSLRNVEEKWKQSEKQKKTAPSGDDESPVR